ncbi:MAG TPA: hypothetical protein VFP87_07315, partial [Chitinophagaceae bacterium]|nr:hypothetical protein [Chitinophagaceae bacterium]
YLKLLDAHWHFAFDGWLTLALLLLLVQELLPGDFSNNSRYQKLFAAIVAGSYGILLTVLFANNSFLTTLFSGFFILVTYAFAWMFIKDIRKAGVSKTVYLLALSAIVCLIVSSFGSITLIYLHLIQSLQPFAYRDASYIYLHLQYNGFFTLTAFALLFHRLYPNISRRSQQRFYFFSVLLCLSIIPSLFLSFLWQNPNTLFRVIAMTGSVSVFLSVSWFIISAFSVFRLSRFVGSAVRNTILISATAFILKMLLQGLTIFKSIGDAVFGDRPVIIGFLHLVFLGFVSTFILAYYIQVRILDMRRNLTRQSLIVFVVGIILNEVVLMFQGVGAMFLKSSYLFPAVLWAISIVLLIGSILIFTTSVRVTFSLSTVQKQQ